MTLSPLIIEDMVRRTLLEDLGHGRDITADSLIPEDLNGTLVMKAREEGILAGALFAETTFKLLDPKIWVTRHTEDGSAIGPGQAILTAEGPVKSILSAERTALNFITHLCGIASETRKYVDVVSRTKASVICTRKTLPGLRMAQKYAVQMGGGKNHRFGLDDGVLIKDNHIALCGGVNQALDQAKKRAGHMVKIEIEVDTLDQLREVLKHGGADIVLLDNMPPETLREAVEMVDGKILTEASGGVNLSSVREIAETGVDLISVGALTHSVRALDIGLDVGV